MKRLLTNVVVFSLACTAAIGQEAKPQSDIIKEFTRSMKVDGIMWSFVLLNDRTVDILFQAPGKYAIRARANMSTTFYVQGMPEKDVAIDTSYSIEQDGQTLQGNALNIKNFAAGNVSKGTRVDGLLQVDKKLDLTHEFKIRGTAGSVDFKLTPEALKLISTQ